MAHDDTTPATWTQPETWHRRWMPFFVLTGLSLFVNGALLVVLA